MKGAFVLKPGQRVLFVCTGNIFRSLVAEHSFRKMLPVGSAVAVSSAGLTAQPQQIHPAVLERMRELGMDPSGHVQRKLTEEILNAADWVIAMGLDHQEALRRDYGCAAPLFLEICRGERRGIPDIWECIPDHANDLAAVRAYVRHVVDLIHDGARTLVREWTTPTQ